MKDFFDKEAENLNIFDRLIFWVEDHFVIIACITYVIFLAFLVYSSCSSQKSVSQDTLWDFPTDMPGTYVRTDPDTNIEYIIVISNGGGIAVCPRERVNNVR